MADGETTNKQRIGDMLIEANLITSAQLDEALALQQDKGGKVVENLIALSHLDAKTFVRFLARQKGTAAIDLLNYTIPKEIIDLVPPHFALRHQILPLDIMGRDLTVGMACPLDSRTVSELESMTGKRVRPLLVSMNDINVALQRYYMPEERAEVNWSDLPGSSRIPSPKVETSEPAPAPPAPAPPTEEADDNDGSEEVDKAASGIRFEGVVHLVRQIHQLPALPETVAQVREKMEDEESSADDLAAVIARDPAIAAKVISLANSAGYGFSHKVDSVEMAVRLLGLREVFSVVLSSAVIDYFSNSRHFDYAAFWRKSVLCGTAARAIGKTCGNQKVGGLFAAALLHGLGRVALAEVAPERYANIDQRLPIKELMEAEEAEFGVAHPEVGWMLADAWDLPIEICEPIRFHRNLGEAKEVPDRVATVALAALLTDAYGKLNKENVAAFAAQCRQALNMLGLGDKDFVRVLGETSAAMKAQQAQAAGSTGAS
jgi:HD-like signal output (HDOD) protein